MNKLNNILNVAIPTGIRTITYNEFNTESIREQAKRMVINLLKDEVDTVMVKCDESLNTPEVIDNREFKIQVGWNINDKWKHRIYTMQYTDCTFDEIL